MGSDSCYVIDPGDLSYKIAFGYNTAYCTIQKKINPTYFNALTEDFDFNEEKNISYSYFGDLKTGNAQLNFSFLHVYKEVFVFNVSTIMSIMILIFMWET